MATTKGLPPARRLILLLPRPHHPRHHRWIWTVIAATTEQGRCKHLVQSRTPHPTLRIDTSSRMWGFVYVKPGECRTWGLCVANGCVLIRPICLPDGSSGQVCRCVSQSSHRAPHAICLHVPKAEHRTLPAVAKAVAGMATAITPTTRGAAEFNLSGTPASCASRVFIAAHHTGISAPLESFFI